MPSKDDPKKQATPLRQGDANGLENLGMEELLDLYDKSTFAESDIVRGRVVKVNASDLVIDIGYKSEGLLPRHEVTGYG
ncbi:MAG: S1 RNA-binding domain-containing protein, partial [Acidobacteriota bacterium]